jgi:thiosulfate dehydrogenase
MKFLKDHGLPSLLGLSSLVWILMQFQSSSKIFYNAAFADSSAWVGPGKYEIPLDSDSGKLIAYGRNLIENTSKYLGPNGSVKQITNGMNCQNCHLNAGTLPWGNNYGAVSSTYPQFRARSGGLETIVKRISDCMERSLNAAKAVDSASREMQAIIAYLHWVGRDVPKNTKPRGSGIMEIPFLDRAANPENGKIVYASKCQRCHGADGLGQKNVEDTGYTYPPLWGNDSYNTAAGLFRLSRFAGYVKNNMPFGEVTYHNPQLTNEEAWDVAAFVNSQSRPSRVFKEDWPDISKKPIDHPFGPFADGFSEEQHKYGPFKPIKQAREEQAKSKK